MAPIEYYTVQVYNKFDAIECDGMFSSDEEYIHKNAPLSKGSISEELKVPENKKEDDITIYQQRGGKNLIPQRVTKIEDSSRGSNRNPKVNHKPSRGAYNGTPNRSPKSEDEIFDENVVKNKFSEVRMRGRGRGIRGGVISRGRDFDRQSGTGKGREIKKGGRGGHNWGNVKDDIKISQDENISRANTIEQQTTDKLQSQDSDINKSIKEMKDKSKETMLDFDSYKAQQAAKRANANLPTYGLHKEQEVSKTNKDIENQINFKETNNKEIEDENEKFAPKNKPINVYEYLHNKGGHIRLFNTRRGRGRDNRRDKEGNKEKYSKERDAPNIQDERVFPKLG